VSPGFKQVSIPNKSMSPATQEEIRKLNLKQIKSLSPEAQKELVALASAAPGKPVSLQFAPKVGGYVLRRTRKRKAPSKQKTLRRSHH
jgi:hypothetical protein